MNDDGTGTGRLRDEVRGKYRDVALQPGRAFGFHTGRPLAERLGYPSSIVDALPGAAVESFAGVGNPFALRPLQSGEKVLDVGCGAISNGAINLCPDKRTVFAEIHRVLRPSGALQFADIANGNPVPAEALRDIDLWAA